MFTVTAFGSVRGIGSKGVSGYKLLLLLWVQSPQEFCLSVFLLVIAAARRPARSVLLLRAETMFLYTGND